MKKIKLISIIILASLLLLTLVGCGGSYADWELSPDGTVLTETVKYNESYHLVGRLVGFHFAGEMIDFANGVKDADGYYYSVYAQSEDPDVVYVTRGGMILVYSKEESLPELDEYLSGVAAASRIVNSYDIDIGRDITDEQRLALDALTPTDTFAVSSLAGAMTHELRVYDSTGALSHAHGGFYTIDGGVYYVNYDALDNSYFDADGNFSYRRGNVDMVKLSGNDELLVTDSSSFDERDEYSYVSEEYSSSEDDIEENANVARAFLVIFFAVFLMLPSLIPLVFMILDLCRRGFRGVNFTTYVIIGAIIIINITSMVIIALAF